MAFCGATATEFEKLEDEIDDLKELVEIEKTKNKELINLLYRSKIDMIPVGKIENAAKIFERKAADYAKNKNKREEEVNNKIARILWNLIGKSNQK